MSKLTEVKCKKCSAPFKTDLSILKSRPAELCTLCLAKKCVPLPGDTD